MAGNIVTDRIQTDTSYASSLAIETNGAERLRIDSSGNMGIGTTSPTQKLELNSGFVKVGNGVGGGGGVWFPYSSDAAGRTWRARTDIVGYGDFGFEQSTTQTGTTFATKMLIDASGNVGIGTASPLNFGGTNLQVQNSTIGSVVWSNGTYIGQLLASAAAEVTVGSRSNHPLRLGTNDTERMRIDTSGNLLVGTTSVYGNAKVSINSATAGNPALAAFKTVTGDTATPAIIVSKFDNVFSTSQVFVQFLYNNGTNGNGQINGNGSGAAAFGSYSDIRLKENITNLPSQLSDIMALRPVEFDWKDGTGHQIGFIAQEVQEVYPDLVGEDAEGMLTLTDMNKNDARLIKCIQEQQALITALTARITALENK